MPTCWTGGSDSDTVSYAARARPVSVDLASAGPVNGERGEGDTLIGIENVFGGKADDRLAGNDANNQLDGAGARDRLIGRGGNDSLSRGGGRISCGPGQDRVSPFVTNVDVIAMPVPARFATERALEYLDPDCEERALHWPTSAMSDEVVSSAYPTQIGPRSVSFSLSAALVCRGKDEFAHCTVTVGLPAVRHAGAGACTADLRRAAPGPPPP
jgi:hypothetical protein